MRPAFTDALRNRILVFDGAMGTMLIEAGAITGTCPEELNVTAPDKVRAVHAAYVAAGADIVETNSFGGSRLKLEKSGMGQRTHELNSAAARIAREAAGDRVYVAGSIGPSSEFLQPLGRLTFQEAVDAFQEQALALADGGADLIIIETMSDLQELKAAVQGVREGPDLPIICSMTFDKRLHTIMGVSPAKAAQAWRELAVAAVGSNCGNGPDEMLQIIAQIKEAFPEGLLMAQPNAGRPRFTEDNKVVYDTTPAQFADFARQFVELGVRIIGGCCGTTPAHIKAVVDSLVK